uniref:Ternary complex factor MIP1 leucine-zipper domain-containing protein n=1 Tax=Chenopodium quinoa TaxID=63459 RepID=A0A803L9M5_CHEQI
MAALAAHLQFLFFGRRRKMEQGLLDSSLRRKAANENTTIQSSIRDFEVLEMGEILQLEKRLQNQFAVRCALENALGSGVSSYEKNEPSTIPKLATNFIKEIAVLELEVGDRRLKSPPVIPRRLFLDEDAAETATKVE